MRHEITTLRGKVIFVMNLKNSKMMTVKQTKTTINRHPHAPHSTLKSTCSTERLCKIKTGIHTSQTETLYKFLSIKSDTVTNWIQKGLDNRTFKKLIAKHRTGQIQIAAGTCRRARSCFLPASRTVRACGAWCTRSTLIQVQLENSNLFITDRSEISRTFNSSHRQQVPHSHQ